MGKTKGKTKGHVPLSREKPLKKPPWFESFSEENILDRKNISDSRSKYPSLNPLLDLILSGKG
jgi:hypothetical protein